MPKFYPPGTVIHEKYEIKKILGEGQFARSMEAIDIDGERPVFLKLYTNPTPVLEWYEGFKRHQDEIKSRLDEISARYGEMTSSVVEGAYEYFEYDDFYWQAKEWICGKNLEELLEEAARNPDSFTVEQRMINTKVFMFALALVHEKGIVHCDLKPANVFMMKSSGKVELRAKLVDFDFSFFHGKNPPWIPDINYVTTPQYESPEHLRGERPSFASDVFTAGIILYEVLCGAHPFADSDNTDDYLHRNCPRPADLNPELPKAVSDMLWAMLDPDPGGRPTAKDVHSVLVGARMDGNREPVRIRLSTGHGYWSIHKTMVFTRQMGKSLGPEYKYLSHEQFEVIKDAKKGAWLTKKAGNH